MIRHADSVIEYQRGVVGVLIFKFNKMKEVIERRKVVPTLRKMEVGEKEVFPLVQGNSISKSVYGSNLAMERSNGFKWSVKTDIEQRIVTVTRTQ